MDIEVLTSRLDKVKKVKDGYLARCPAHDDKRPSLVIREVGDKILVHCFAGCGAAEIMEAIDLSISDLFADSKESRNPISYKDALFSVRREMYIVYMACNDIINGKELGPENLSRIRTARERLNTIMWMANARSY